MSIADVIIKDYKWACNNENNLNQAEIYYFKAVLKNCFMQGTKRVIKVKNSPKNCEKTPSKNDNRFQINDFKNN